MKEFQADEQDIVQEPTALQKKLFQRKAYRDEYETRIFDMMRAGELSEQEYIKMKSASTASFEQFKQQFLGSEQNN